MTISVGPARSAIPVVDDVRPLRDDDALIMVAARHVMKELATMKTFRPGSAPPPGRLHF